MKALLLALTLFQASCVTCQAENWQRFFEVDSSMATDGMMMQYGCYYDSDSIVYVDKKTVRVWYKTDEPVLRMNGKVLSIEGGGLASTIALLQFDCPQRRYKLLEGSFTMRGETKNMNPTMGWLYPKPGDEREALYKEVCGVGK